MATATTTNPRKYTNAEEAITAAGLTPVQATDLENKFNAATRAEYARQRTDLQNTTNQYYNQLYNTQDTALDTIRKANAQAVATGASRGVQAANELASILGLQSESAQGAADLANTATTLAQDEATQILQNALDAETQANEMNQALANIFLGGRGVDVQERSVDVEQQNAVTARGYNAAQAYALAEQIRQTDPALADSVEQYLNALFNTQTSGSDTASKEAFIQRAPVLNDTANTLFTGGFNASTAALKEFTDQLKDYTKNLNISEKVNLQQDIAQLEQLNADLLEFEAYQRGEKSFKTLEEVRNFWKKYGLPENRMPLNPRLASTTLMGLSGYRPDLKKATEDLLNRYADIARNS